MIIWLERGHDEVFASTRPGAFIHQSSGLYRQHAGQRFHCIAGPYDRYAIDGFIGCGLALVLGALVAVSAGHWLWNMPNQLRRARLEKNRQDGDAALAGGLMALARGDAVAADEATRLARKKMPQQALPLLMAAQAALLDGRRDDAAANYHAMLEGTTLSNDRRQQISLGLEGLYYLARAEQDAEAAGTYALQVLEVDSKALWALDGLMTLAVQIGDWPAAEKWLRRWGRAGRSRGEIKRRAIFGPRRSAKPIGQRRSGGAIGSGKKGRAGGYARR